MQFTAGKWHLPTRWKKKLLLSAGQWISYSTQTLNTNLYETFDELIIQKFNKEKYSKKQKQKNQKINQNQKRYCLIDFKKKKKKKKEE